MRTEHTPGPWEVSRLSDDTILAGPAKTLVAYVATVGMGDDVGPNARLVAAAPDLLAALKLAWEHGDLPPHIRAAMSAAIAKAEPPR